MDSQNAEQPPAFQSLNKIELYSTKDSKISSVSVYTDRAEITRQFKFIVQTGHNRVVVNGLPSSLDQQSLRVEGRGAGTIHDVAIEHLPRPSFPSTSPTLAALSSERNRALNAVERSKTSIASLQSCLSTLHVNQTYTDLAVLSYILRDYDSTGELLDNQLLDLQNKLSDIDKKVEIERAKLTTEVTFDERLNVRATIGVFADQEGEVEITLIYATYGASWNAEYEIRVEMQAKQEPVTLVYKASITQSTGEDWIDVPLTLETATPTFGIDVPTLEPWNLSIRKPLLQPVYRSGAPPPPPGALAQLTRTQGMERKSMARRQADIETEYDTERMIHRELEVSSKGNLNATFQVPGMISIPGDNASHTVTIARLKLNATMSWVCVPKKDPKILLNAKIKNASSYTLLSGTGGVYIDGSFISRSEVPAVSPDESFDCPLGLDPSIRVTYLPLITKQAASGFYTKTTHRIFSQNITVHNTRSTPIDKIKIIDQFPISEDSQIQVKYISPSLGIPPSSVSGGGGSSGTGNSTNAIEVMKKPVQISTGVVAMWDGADADEQEAVGVEALGRNGKFVWVCKMPPQGKMNLLLQWEVVAPAKMDIAGLI